MTIGLVSGQFDVSEEAGEVNVCVSFIGENVAEFNIPVAVNTEDASATGLQVKEHGILVTIEVGSRTWFCFF